MTTTPSPLPPPSYSHVGPLTTRVVPCFFCAVNWPRPQSAPCHDRTFAPPCLVGSSGTMGGGNSTCRRFIEGDRKAVWIFLCFCGGPASQTLLDPFLVPFCRPLILKKIFMYRAPPCCAPPLLYLPPGDFFGPLPKLWWPLFQRKFWNPPVVPPSVFFRPKVGGGVQQGWGHGSWLKFWRIRSNNW